MKNFHLKMMNDIQLIHGDCLEKMKSIPDGSIDCVITDPPYGLGIDGQKRSISNNPKHNRKAHEFKEWDNAIPPKEYFDEMIRISKNQIIWGGNYFIKYLTEGHKGWIVWDKGQHGLTMSDGELAYSSFDSPLRIFTFNRVELLLDRATHPTQKPVKLMKFCIETFTEKGQTILDPFMGSGTTGVACIQTGRNFIGIELNEGYFDIAKRRIETAQLPLL